MGCNVFMATSGCHYGLYLLRIYMHACMQDELAQQVIKAMCCKFAGSAQVSVRAYGHAAGRGSAQSSL